MLLASRSYTDPDLLSPAEIFFGDTRVRLVAAHSLVLPRMDGCDPMFSQALYGGLDPFVQTEYDAYLLPSWSGVGKARQGLVGSLLRLANGGLAHVPLASNSLSEKAGQLHVVVRFHSGEEDKKIKLSTLGSTVTHISPALLSSHVDEQKRAYKEGTGAKDLRESDGGAPVRLIVSRLKSGKTEITRHLVDGGDDTSTTDATEALDGLNRAWLSVASTDDQPPPQDECPPESSVDLDVWVYRQAARQYRRKREADMVDAAGIDRELDQSPETALFKTLATSTALRLVNALRALTLIPPDGSMYCQLSWLALVIASLAGIPTWANVVAEALARSLDFAVEIVSALVNWFEATYKPGENVSLSEFDLAARRRTADGLRGGFRRRGQVGDRKQGQVQARDRLGRPEGPQPRRARRGDRAPLRPRVHRCRARAGLADVARHRHERRVAALLRPRPTSGARRGRVPRLLRRAHVRHDRRSAAQY